MTARFVAFAQLAVSTILLLFFPKMHCLGHIQTQKLAFRLQIVSFLRCFLFISSRAVSTFAFVLCCDGRSFLDQQ
jgi:hypothetical protein